MRSAAADNLFPLVLFLEEEDEGDLDAMAVADRVGESVAVIFAVGWWCLILISGIDATIVHQYIVPA